MRIKFLGGVGTVTGSRHLLELEKQRVLVDCGMFQGVKNLRERNWAPFPVEPKSIDRLLLTHAHVDHTGYIPALVKNGFKGPIICTRATYELCQVLLPDAGFLQEEDARYANRKKFSRHHPAEPLFTEKDARHALKQFEPVHFHEDVEVVKDFKATFMPVGHILGSAAVICEHKGIRIGFSGDVGRQNDLVMRRPEPLPDNLDYLVVESTYGNRRHDETDPFTFLADIINQTTERGGIVLVPSFAVGRAQTLLHIIQELKAQDRISNIPVYLNSPMAITATEIFCKHHKEHKLSAAECHRIDEGTHYVRTAEESIELNSRRYPSIIISASGMASGGRVLHHLKSLAPHHNNSIVFVGFQAPGTRGDAIVHGAEHVKIHGQYIPVKAQVHHLDSLSAHGDYSEILDWLGQSQLQPKQVFVTHGEPLAADEMRKHLQERFGWKARVPESGEDVLLDGQA